MSWYAIVPPRKNTQDATGMCLRFAQSFFGAPVRYASAWEAWQHVQGKYSPSDPLPPVPVLLWFEHWGTYGSPPTYGNWGHVAVYVPGDAIYTSPAWGYGQGRYGTINEIERVFNSRYVGWSSDINGLQVAGYSAPAPNPAPKPLPPKPKEITVITYRREDLDARKKGRVVRPGNHIYLNTKSGGATNFANCVGGVGEYALSAHLYAQGKPGDKVDLAYVWQDKAGKNSPHYTETLVFDNTGNIRATRTFLRGVASGYRVMLRVTAHKANTGEVKVTTLDSDAHLYKAA